MTERSVSDRVRAVLENRVDLTIEERQRRAAELKAQAHVDDPSTPTDGDPIPLAWEDDDIVIVVEQVEHDAARNFLRVFLSAFRSDGTEIDTLDLPYEYHNPPVRIGFMDGENVDSYEDVAATFKSIVTDTVRHQAG